MQSQTSLTPHLGKNSIVQNLLILIGSLVKAPAWALSANSKYKKAQLHLESNISQCGLVCLLWHQTPSTLLLLNSSHGKYIYITKLNQTYHKSKYMNLNFNTDVNVFSLTKLERKYPNCKKKALLPQKEQRKLK